ncbi:MAG TPA: AEC family transporter [Dehalococcoidales bacterium]|nr:AEC family transporter [Dehalococcoidales bacterium]
MNVFFLTFQAVAALLGIGILGFWIIGRRKLPSNVLGLLNSIAIDITLPCLVLGNLLTRFSPQDLAGWWSIPLWFFGFQGFILVLSLLSAYLVNRQFRSEFSLSLFLQNGMFFPLIIITGLFVSEPGIYLVTLFLFSFIHPTIAFTVYPYFFRNQKNSSSLNWQRLINPVMIATVAGILLGVTNLTQYVPDFITMIVTLVGAMALPLFMLILGGNIYNDFKQNKDSGKRFYWPEIIKFVLIKNVLFPAIILGLLIWLKPDYPLALIMVLQAAVPPITAIPLFVERSGGNRMITNQFIVASFLASIVTIPAVIMVFSRFFPFPV